MLAVAASASISGGCQKKLAMEPLRPDYEHQLKPGESALRLITDPARMPDLAAAYRNRVTFQLDDAIGQSVKWFEAPSSKQSFPFESFSHEQARASVSAFGQIINSAADESDFVKTITDKFDVYESVGYNGEGTVLFTGYYAPVFKASRTMNTQFMYPLYRRPGDLATDPKNGKPLGRRLADGSTTRYYTRREIDGKGLLKGSELVWLEDPLSVYIVQVNGSAKLQMTDGSEMYVGYAGKTDWPYMSLSQMMLDEGLLKPEERNLPAMRNAYRAHPDEVIDLINQNQSYVFFTEYTAEKWPSGSLGVRVTDETTLATDKAVYPRGGVVMVDTQAVTFSVGKRRFQRFMLDQDTGGAIRAPGRADIFMGIGQSAEILAGGQYAEGKLYYFFLKPQFVDEYLPKSAPSKKTRKN